MPAKQKVFLLSDQRRGMLLDLSYEDGIADTPNKLGSWDINPDLLYPFSNKVYKTDSLPMAPKGPLVAVATNHDCMVLDLSAKGLLAKAQDGGLPPGKLLVTGRNAMAKGINKATRRSIQEKIAETILMIVAPCAFLIILVFAVGLWKAGYFSGIPFIGGK